MMMVVRVLPLSRQVSTSPSRKNDGAHNITISTHMTKKPGTGGKIAGFGGEVVENRQVP